MIFIGLDNLKRGTTQESKRNWKGRNGGARGNLQGFVNAKSKENSLFSSKLKKVRKMAITNACTPAPNDFDAILKTYDIR